MRGAFLWRWHGSCNERSGKPTGHSPAQEAILSETKTNMKVKDIMTKDPETVGPGTPIGDVAGMMRDLNVGIVPVVREGELLGVITDRDITVRVTAAGLLPYDTTVQDFISPNAITLSP